MGPRRNVGGDSDLTGEGDDAIAFYDSAGSDVDAYDSGLAFVRYADASVFDLDLNGGLDPSNNGAGCYIIIDDADRWHTRLLAAGLLVSAINEMPWGMREFTLRDPSANAIRIGHRV